MKPMTRHFIFHAAFIATALAASTVEAQTISCADFLSLGGSYVLSNGTYDLHGDCSLQGDLILKGDAVLAVNRSSLSVHGNIGLSSHAALRVTEGALNLANDFVQQFSITAQDETVLTLKNSTLKTNSGKTSSSLSSGYNGFGNSVFVADNVTLDGRSSWLLGNFRDNAKLKTINSPSVP